MLSRMLGAARLSVDTFEDVERDSSATIQALIVVIIVALASGIGELLSGEADILRALVFGLIRGIISWAIWALIAMFVGTKILKTEQTEADWGQLARGTGFAQTPGILTVLVFVPAVGTSNRTYSALLAIGGDGSCRSANSRLHINLASLLRYSDSLHPGINHQRDPVLVTARLRLASNQQGHCEKGRSTSTAPQSIRRNVANRLHAHSGGIAWHVR